MLPYIILIVGLIFIVFAWNKNNRQKRSLEKKSILQEVKIKADYAKEHVLPISSFFSDEKIRSKADIQKNSFKIFSNYMRSGLFSELYFFLCFSKSSAHFLSLSINAFAEFSPGNLAVLHVQKPSKINRDIDMDKATHDLYGVGKDGLANNRFRELEIEAFQNRNTTEETNMDWLKESISSNNNLGEMLFKLESCLLMKGGESVLVIPYLSRISKMQKSVAAKSDFEGNRQKKIEKENNRHSVEKNVTTNESLLAVSFHLGKKGQQLASWFLQHGREGREKDKILFSKEKSDSKPGWHLEKKDGMHTPQSSKDVHNRKERIETKPVEDLIVWARDLSNHLHGAVRSFCHSFDFLRELEPRLTSDNTFLRSSFIRLVMATKKASELDEMVGLDLDKKKEETLTKSAQKYGNDFSLLYNDFKKEGLAWKPMLFAIALDSRLLTLGTETYVAGKLQYFFDKQLFRLRFCFLQRKDQKKNKEASSTTQQVFESSSENNEAWVSSNQLFFETDVNVENKNSAGLSKKTNVRKQAVLNENFRQLEKMKTKKGEEENRNRREEESGENLGKHGNGSEKETPIDPFRLEKRGHDEHLKNDIYPNRRVEEQTDKAQDSLGLTSNFFGKGERGERGYIFGHLYALIPYGLDKEQSFANLYDRLAEWTMIHIPLRTEDKSAHIKLAKELFKTQILYVQDVIRGLGDETQ